MNKTTFITGDCVSGNTAYYTFKCKNLDLAQIASSGQCFRWKVNEDGSFRIPAFGKVLNISQNGDEFTCGCTEEEFLNIWKKYFDIECGTDYEKIGELILTSDDEYLKIFFRDNTILEVIPDSQEYLIRICGRLL